MEKKIDRRVRKTKQQLQDGFIQLRKKKDLKDITVEELCELTDLNRGLFIYIIKIFMIYLSN